MSHQVVLAARTARGWSGVHIQWGLAAWVLPGLYEAVTARMGGAGDRDELLRAAVGEVIETCISLARSGYSRFDSGPVGDRKDRRVGSRSTVWGSVHELLYVLDPADGTVEVSTRERCPTHQPPINALFAQMRPLAPGERRTGYVCPAGVADRPNDRGVEVHPAHRIRGCGCLCTGGLTSRFEPRLRFSADDPRPARLLRAMERDGVESRDELTWTSQLLAAPAGACELYAAMREQGADHASAWEAAGLVYADPD